MAIHPDPAGKLERKEQAVLFAYAMCFFSGIAGVLGYIGLFEKEINKKFGTSKEEDTEPFQKSEV